MNKRKSLWGCLLVIVLVLIILAIGGGLWLFRTQPGISEFTPPSQVLVFLLAPSSGDEVKAGDFVPVTAQTVAPEEIQSIELFLDGQSLGKTADPSNASWTWQAWPLGLHTFTARATNSNGKVGESQAVLVNVLAGDGTMQTFAEEGQTLAQIGAGFGVPPEQMAGANPNFDPAEPLQNGQPVKVPIGNGGAGSGSGQGSGGNQNYGVGPLLIPIEWKIKFTQPVDKSYCYTSGGNGVWEKMPKDPFNFFEGTENLITQLNQAAKQVIIQVQCWGWLGEVLKFLGQGQTQFDLLQPPGEVKIDGGGFVMTGVPKIPPIKEDQFLDAVILDVPPPYALREPKTSADCMAHSGGSPVINSMCQKLDLLAKKGTTFLEWEWSPKICWTGSKNCHWYNNIAGYRVYAINSTKNTRKLLWNPAPSDFKVAFLPSPVKGGDDCYGVEAYVGYVNAPPSEMVLYCGVPPKLQKTELYPSVALTEVNSKKIGAGCANAQLGKNLFDEYYSSGFNQKALYDVMVGAYHEAFGTAGLGLAGCTDIAYYTGTFKYDIPVSILPAGAIIQEVRVYISLAHSYYHGSGKEPAPCISGIGRAKQDWTALNDGDRLITYHGLSGSAYNAPIKSLSGNYLSSWNVDVTSVVKDWIKNPSTNHGFILMPGNPPPIVSNISCVAGFRADQLVITYFAPP